MTRILLFLLFSSVLGLRLTKDNTKIALANGAQRHEIKPDQCQEMQQTQEELSQDVIGKFKILLCRDAALNGFFRLHKLKGCKPQTVISENKETDHEARLLGEDEFFLSLEGPEVRPLKSVTSEDSLNTCTYDLPFKLSLPGKYHVNLKWYRENFEGAKETTKDWPPNHFDKPLGENVFVHFGSSWSESIFGDGQNPSLDMVLSQKNMPECNSQQLNEGRWVFTGNPKDMFETPPDNRCGKGQEPCPEGYKMDPKVDYRKYTWLADNCRQRQFTREEAAICLENRTLEMRGDSFMRKLFYHLQTFACGYTGGDEKTPSACNYYPGKCARVCYVTDFIGSSPGSLDFDFVVGNFGQHLATSKYRSTLEQYKKKVDTYGSQVEQLMKKKGKHNFAWYETSIVPFRDDHYVYSKKDGRTGSRLQLFNNYANKKFSTLGVPIIQSYERTRAFSHHTNDDAHYPIEVTHPMVNDILNLMCP